MQFWRCIFSWEYPTHAKWGEQESLPAEGHRSAHTCTPTPTLWSHFPTASQPWREAWEQPSLVRGHWQHRQRRCLPLCQTLQVTHWWQIPTSSLKTGPVRKGLYQFQLASCLGFRTGWYSHGDNKKQEGSPLSFSARNFVRRFFHLIRKTVPRRKIKVFNSISSFKCFGFPSWNHLTPSMGSFHYNKLGCPSWQL